MTKQKLQALKETYLYGLSIQQLEERLDSMPDWDKDRLDLVKNLPTNLQFSDQLIISTGTRDYRETPYFLANGDFVQLVNDSGWLNMGWDRPVNPKGHFSDGAVYGPSGEEFTVSDANKFCFIGGTKTFWFKNERVSNWGGSITTDTGFGWDVKLDTSNFHYAFNDEDSNQSGGAHNVTLRIWRAKVLFKSVLDALKLAARR